MQYLALVGIFNRLKLSLSSRMRICFAALCNAKAILLFPLKTSWVIAEVPGSPAYRSRGNWKEVVGGGFVAI